MPRRRPPGHVVLVGSVVLVVVLVAIGGLVGPGLNRRFGHRRDVGAFRTSVMSVVSSTGGFSGRNAEVLSDTAWVRGHPDDVVAAGDRACRWLSSTPKAPHLDPTRHFGEDNLVSQYLGTTATSPDASPPYSAPGSDVGLPLSLIGRQAVVDSAWTHLCWRTRYTHTARAYAGD